MSQARQDLILYKRHYGNCGVEKTKLPTKSRRFWFECGCPIWIEGMLPDGSILPRQSTGHNDSARAEAFKNALLEKTSVSKLGMTIEQATDKYLAGRRDLGVKAKRQTELALSRFRQYCEGHDAQYATQITVDTCESFKTEGLPEEMAETSRATNVAKVICFLREAYRRDWISVDLARKVLPYTAAYDQKEPYSDDEVARILDETLNLNGGTHGYAKYPATFRLLLELMLETGMRVGDAVRFNPRELQKGAVLWIYTLKMQKQKKGKQKKFIEVYISNDLKTRIDNADWLSDLPFYYGSFANESYLGNEVYSRMQTIGGRCGVADCRPHRLRDTFAVRRLIDGLGVDDVSRLLGHSSVRVTELYYAKWITARKKRLERLLAESLANPLHSTIGNTE